MPNKTNLDAEGSRNDVAVLATVVSHERRIWRRGSADLIDSFEEVDSVFVGGAQLFPTYARVEVDGFALLWTNDGLN